ncbi:hypothetical protein NE237_026741 [Protea cynaroides]|uniref:Uncharacterized protein n=1 Tax=Protea cynaroides TaxID=273540 RepID=A0A9Q0JTA6_9MAGN|nr:hypothetical protein NE237_026741 [Protea cynaroides]
MNSKIVNKVADDVSRSDLGKAEVNENGRLPRGPVDVTQEITEPSMQLDEEWTPIRVKKKRSSASHGGLNPTHILTNLSPTLRQSQPKEHVSNPGKSFSTVSNNQIPSQELNFPSSVKFSKSAAYTDSAICSPNHFECLAVGVVQSVLTAPVTPQF